MSQSYTILHLEDNPVFVNMTKILFENQKNINYESVFTPEQAFNYLIKNMPDIILSDLQLDDLTPESGIRFIKQVKNKYPNIPIVVLSSKRSKDIRENLSEYILDFFQKGCDTNFFVSNIMNHLKKFNSIPACIK